MAITNQEIYLCVLLKVRSLKAQASGITAAAATPNVPPRKEKYIFTFSKSRATAREDPTSQMFIFL